MKKAYIYSSGKQMSEKPTLKTTKILNQDNAREMELLLLFPQMKYQKIIGFGGAFTGSTCYNLMKLSETQRRKAMKMLFNDDGLCYNFCRTTIHSSDFSPQIYTYLKEDAENLDSFSIDCDREYVIPIINSALMQNKDIMLFASAWTPPAFMKSNNSMFQGGELKESHKQMWADYMVKYLKAYRDEGIDIFAVTVQNEPHAVQTWESCSFTAEQEADFIENYLVPSIEKSELGTKIIAWDHNKERLFDRANEIMSDLSEKSQEQIFGFGFHWYSGTHFDSVRMTKESYPNKALILTEFCKGDGCTDYEVTVNDTVDFIEEIIGDLNNGTSAICDWNMVLDTNGGPCHNRAFGCKSGIVADLKSNEILCTPLYNAMSHFSRFIKRDAKIIGTSSYSSDILMTAAENPDGEIATVILNKSAEDKSYFLKIEDTICEVGIPACSTITVIIK